MHGGTKDNGFIFCHFCLCAFRFDLLLSAAVVYDFFPTRCRSQGCSTKNAPFGEIIFLNAFLIN